MAEDISQMNAFPNRDLTDIVYEDLCFGDIFYDEEFNLDDIHVASDLDSRPVFLEGVVCRLQSMGFQCDTSDKNTILTEIKRRYKEILGIPCPRTVQEWIKGTTPSVTERKNNYDLCYALEMNLEDTGEFFLKHYLTLPFNYKDTTDAIFFYCLYHRHPYEVVKQLLDATDTFDAQEASQTATLQIGRQITTITNIDEFLEYLSHHCYNNEQQYQVARKKIQDLASRHSYKSISDLHEQLMGFKYQEIKREKWIKNRDLPISTYRQAINEYLQCSGAMDFSVIGRARCYRKLYEIYHKYGKTEAAKKRFDQAKDCYMDSLGDQHPEVQEFLNSTTE